MIFHSRHSSRISKSEGFIALISILIIAAILEGVAIAASLSVSLAMNGIVDSQNALQNLLNSESCEQIESLRLATNPAYAGNEKIILPQGFCITHAVE